MFSLRHLYQRLTSRSKVLTRSIDRLDIVDLDSASRIIDVLVYAFVSADNEVLILLILICVMRVSAIPSEVDLSCWHWQVWRCIWRITSHSIINQCSLRYDTTPVASGLGTSHLFEQLMWDQNRSTINRTTSFRRKQNVIWRIQHKIRRRFNLRLFFLYKV